MKQQQKTEKFCCILSRLTDEILEFISFYGDTAIFATEWELEHDYEDTYYDTNVTVNDDLTATVLQTRKGYFEAFQDLDRATLNKIIDEQDYDLLAQELATVKHLIDTLRKEKYPDIDFAEATLEQIAQATGRNFNLN